MPIPPLPPSSDSPSIESARRWFVLHTKSRQEKAVAETLGKLGVRHVLPLVRRNSYYGKRKVEVDFPLFPSYLFMHGEPEQAYAIDRTKRIARIIPVVDGRVLERELKDLETALANVTTFDPFPYLTKGVRVEVRAGPLQGVRGLIEDRTKRNRLILQVEILGQATSTEVDGALLEVVE